MDAVRRTYQFQLVIWIIGYNLLGVTLYFLLFPMRSEIDPTMNFGFWNGILINTACGIVTGSLLGTIDLFLDRVLRKKASFRRWFAIKSLLYVASFATLGSLTAVGVRLAKTGDLEASVAGAGSEDGIYTLVGFLFFSIFYSLAVSFFGQVRKMYGKGVLRDLFFGKYFQPKLEERVFLFIDLKDSTSIAEQLGALQYSQFIQDCFFDLSKPLRHSSGSLYQYVGDEAIISCRKSEANKKLHCVDIFFAFLQELEIRRTYYQQTYGIEPEFKAGAHVGAATVAEISGTKHELAFHGDVLNTAARLQNKSGSLGEKLLISGALLELLVLSPERTAQSLGPLDLRGKHQVLETFAIR